MKKPPLETSHRSLLKSVSYRVLSIAADSFVAFVITHDVAVSAGIVLFVNAYSTVLYYFHERAWARLPLGHTGVEARAH